MSGSLRGTLSTAAGALQAHQRASQVAAHNIANALTRGFSRQRAELAALHPLATPHGPLGTGVRVSDIGRARDILLDDFYRQATAAASGDRMRHGVLERMELALGEPGPAGFGAALDAFWAGWSDLANDPLNAGARSLLLDSGRTLAQRLNALGANADAMRDEAAARLSDGITTFNRLAAQVADLNRRIAAAEAGGATAADLRDARDLALDEMATIAAIEVVEQRNGAVRVHLGGVTVVDGADARAVEVKYESGVWELRTTRGRTIGHVQGAAGKLLHVLNEDVPHLRGRLDALARSIVASVNSLHAQGTNALGETGVEFFHVPDGDLGKVTAGTIAISAAVLSDPRRIAAGTGGGAGEYRPGANDIALAIAQLRDTPDDLHLGGSSPMAYYVELTSGFAQSVASARDWATVNEVMAAQAEQQRFAVIGVSTDEELIRLVEHQTAYAAAARVVTTVDEMLATLLNMV